MKLFEKEPRSADPLTLYKVYRRANQQDSFQCTSQRKTLRATAAEPEMLEAMGGHTGRVVFPIHTESKDSTLAEIVEWSSALTILALIDP
jgi:hypothetical protein